ncbi:MAG: hypothetical protein AAF467_19660 [Actinomycetota bacterium]
MWSRERSVRAGLLALGLGLALAGTACSSDDDAAPATAEDTATTAETTAAPTTSTTTAAADDSAAQAADETDAEELFPDVIGAEASQGADGTWAFSATLSSPYDTPERYADAWRVVGPDGTVFGTRELAHDHANEQPFTRSLNGVEIPDDVATVTIEGRDQVSGWGGATVDVELAR